MVAIQGQSQIIEMQNKSYYYDGHSYNDNTIGDILRSSDQADILYKRSVNAKQLADLFGYSSITGLVVSSIFFYKSTSKTGFLGGLNEQIYGLSAFIVASIAGITGLNYRSKQMHYLERAIDQYNMDYQVISQQEVQYLRVVGKDAGIGLLYTF